MDNAVVALAREDKPSSVASGRLDAAVKRAAAGSLTTDDFEVFRAASESMHPSKTYGVDCARLRRAYLGDLEGLARDALSRRYPKTWRRMPVVTQNIVRETAELDAQVYRAPPSRAINGDRDAAREVADSVHLDEVMVEVERVSSLCGSVFIRHDEEAETLSVVWPHCSAVVPSDTRRLISTWPASSPSASPAPALTCRWPMRSTRFGRARATAGWARSTRPRPSG